MGSQQGETNNKIGGGCHGDVIDCEDVDSWECYDQKTHDSCCTTCKSYELQPSPAPNCTYGDRISDCNVDGGRRCYDANLRADCCETCKSYETNIQGCKYGDKLRDCRYNECLSYSKEGRDNCCFTCHNVNSSTWTTWSPSTTWSTTIQGSGVTDANADSPSGVPGWVAPVLATCGGALLLLVLALVCIMYRRRHSNAPKHLSPFDERMYNEYKLTKRAPMALPRGPSKEKDFEDERRPSAEYAYINPEHVGGPLNTERRLPTEPAEYLDLEAHGPYSYAEPQQVDALKLDTLDRTYDVSRLSSKGNDVKGGSIGILAGPYEALNKGPRNVYNKSQIDQSGYI